MFTLTDDSQIALKLDFAKKGFEFTVTPGGFQVVDEVIINVMFGFMQSRHVDVLIVVQHPDSPLVTYQKEFVNRNPEDMIKVVAWLNQQLIGFYDLVISGIELGMNPAEEGFYGRSKILQYVIKELREMETMRNNIRRAFLLDGRVYDLDIVITHDTFVVNVA